MKLLTSSNLFGACALLGCLRSAFAIVNCNVEVGRVGITGDVDQICSHFNGEDPDGYLLWLTNNDITSKYPNMAFLPGSDPENPANGAAVHWKVDDEFVYLAVAGRAHGWLAFGLAEAGGMNGADMVIFTASRPNELRDAYTTDDRMPRDDECASDWELVASHVDHENGFLMFETKRKLNTGDPQDKIIFNDASSLIPPHRVIAAWGDQEEIGFHGLDRARGAIRFYGKGDEASTFASLMTAEAEGSFEVRSINHEISTNETEYAYTCIDRPGLLDKGVLDTQDMLNIIGFEPIIEEGNEAHVHHFLVSASSKGNCSSAVDFVFFGEMIYVWAPGEASVSLPDFLGAPLFGDDGYQVFRIEVHYNNPTNKAGVIDNSGVRMYWTSEPRDEQMGFMMIGDAGIGAFGQPVGTGYTLHQFDCPGACSSVVGRPVTVLREYLHMHEIGARMTNEQIRDDQVIRTGSVDFWEFEQNGNLATLQDPFEVLPGDSFRTSCYYKSDEERVFGFGSSDEMCMAFLMYYPRVHITSKALEEAMGEEFPQEFEVPWMCSYQHDFPQCNASYTMTPLLAEDDLDRAFSVKPDTCSPRVQEGGSENEPNNTDSSSDFEGDGSSAASFTAGTYALFSVLALVMCM